ncbi:transketolase family protein [Agrobacterium sp. NPDC090283]|uniref:transketolase family protein n=1 Tax=Agrobacterium sp. NPDC090283 TaxID=3363920 RepID=UPI00383BED74
MDRTDIRNAYGDALLQLAAEEERLVAIVADSRSSSKLDTFAERFPSRLYEVGVAEQNMLGVAAGLAAVGFIPFASAIANFALMRPFEQFRTVIGYSNVPVKVAGMSSGLAFPFLGGSHCALEDLAISRSVPNVVVLYPADYWEAVAAVKASFYSNGPVYIRFGRQSPSDIYTAEPQFQIGRSSLLAEGSDVFFLAAGPMVSEVLSARQLLESEGISSVVANISCIKPLDKELISRVSQRVRCIITVEEHSVIGGLGSAVAELLAEIQGPPLMRLGVPDMFTVPGPRQSVLNHFGLTAENIAQRAQTFLLQ